MLAAVACGEYGSVKEAAEKLTHVVSTEEPNPAIAERYEARYQTFRKIYPALKDVYPMLI